MSGQEQLPRQVKPLDGFLAQSTLTILAKHSVHSVVVAVVVVALQRRHEKITALDVACRLSSGSLGHFS